MHLLRHLTTNMGGIKSSPGWVWYDLLFDVPHTDRWGVAVLRVRLRAQRGSASPCLTSHNTRTDHTSPAQPPALAIRPSSPRNQRGWYWGILC